MRPSNHTLQELFTSFMAKESFSVAQSQNRRLLKLQDITDIMHNQVCVWVAHLLYVREILRSLRRFSSKWCERCRSCGGSAEGVG